MYMEKEYEELQNTTQETIDDVYESLQNTKNNNKGKNFKMKFHNSYITSDMTLDEAYIAGTGMSIEEWRQEDRKNAEKETERKVEEIKQKNIDERTEEEKQILGEYEARKEGYIVVPYDEHNRRLSTVDGVHSMLKQEQEKNGYKYSMVYEGYRIDSDMSLSEVYINHDDYMKKKTDAILQKPEEERTTEEKGILELYEQEKEDQIKDLEWNKHVVEEALKRTEEERGVLGNQSFEISKERVKVLEDLNAHRVERDGNQKEEKEMIDGPFDANISPEDSKEAREYKEDIQNITNKFITDEKEDYRDFQAEFTRRQELMNQIPAKRQVKNEKMDIVNTLSYESELKKDQLSALLKDQREKESNDIVK